MQVKGIRWLASRSLWTASAGIVLILLLWRYA